MERLHVTLEEGPHGTSQGEHLREAGARGTGSRQGLLLWNITVTLKILAPESWWKQARQYFPDTFWMRRRPSESDDHRRLTQDDFETPVPAALLEHLNALAGAGDRDTLRSRLPESFIRVAIVHTNVDTLATILDQRGHYDRGHWHLFCSQILDHPELSPFFGEREETHA